MTLPVRNLGGIREIVDDYDLFLFDQWGVVHDGQQLYGLVQETLNTLRKVPGKTLLVVSNSSRRASYSLELMRHLGLDPKVWDEVITSGEHCLSCLHDRPEGLYASLGRQYYCIAWPEGYILPDGWGYQETLDIGTADFILVTGISMSLEDYMPVLQQALDRGLPMICANPDLFSPEGTEIKACPGLIAERYKAMGGVVSRHGKPAKEMYDLILQKYPTPRDRVLAIGDSLAHDIQGANNAGIHALLLTQGIHRHEWHAHRAEGASIEKASVILSTRYKVHFDYVATGLCW